MNCKCERSEFFKKNYKIVRLHIGMNLSFLHSNKLFSILLFFFYTFKMINYVNEKVKANFNLFHRMRKIVLFLRKTYIKLNAYL